MWLCFVIPALLSAQPLPAPSPNPNVEAVRRTPGLAAFWDFTKRTQDGRFDAWQPPGSRFDLSLDAVNYIRDYWNQGRPATYADFPLLPEGPFGQAVQFQNEANPDFRPLLLVPRSRLHDSPIDVKGPGRSVSMIVWLKRSTGNHAIAGIWHEGTDLHSASAPVTRVERGMRQYALFAGLAANPGAAAVHVSENGAASFTDKYARNLAVTKEKIAEGEWTAVGFVFDNARNQATAYWNGVATDYWIENPQNHPFFQWPAKGWQDRSYAPPETKPKRRRIEQTADLRIEEWTSPYTKLRVRFRRTGKQWKEESRELIALRVNPYYFSHDLYTPPGPDRGGPFTIGRVIHTSRSVGFTGAIGGVAVFDRALKPSEMRRLSAIGQR